MHRLRTLSRRQAVLLTGAALLCAAVAGTALTGHFGIALTVLAVFFAALLGGLLLLARRLTRLQATQRKSQADVRTVLDQTQRRLLGAVEELLLNAGDRHRELVDALAAQHRTHVHGTGLLLRSQTREVEALVQLFGEITPRAPMPASGGHALNPTDLLDLVHLVRSRRPRLVLELGSGTSTVWIAYVLQQTGGRLISVDHEREYADRTRQALTTHGLTDVAEVRHAPLRPVAIEGRGFGWYDVEGLDDVRDVDLLLVDGPDTAERYPVARLLEKQLAGDAVVLETSEGLTVSGEALVVVQ